MCGIVACITSKNVEKKLIENLKLLEYRGYDSAGIATIKNNKLSITKQVGNISNLENMIKDSENSIGIAHTRWATHGKATTNNAHPHSSNDLSWAIVHNGIIENYNILKNELLIKGYTFLSLTDTEVIANLMQDNNLANLIETIIKTCDFLNGSFALAILNKNKADTLYLAKRKSPLYLAKSDNEILVASDPICFIDKVNQYYTFEDDEFCEASLKDIIFYNKNGEIIKKTATILNTYNSSTSKLHYSHYMLKEIEETPQILKELALKYRDHNIFDRLNNLNFNEFNKIILLGCGTAYHAGLMAKAFIENFARIDANAYISSEFRYSNPLLDSRSLVICVSQSGETADTLMAQELAKSKGATTIALTNVLHSTLARQCDYYLPTYAGPEISVASTKAYSAQISILNMLAKYISNRMNNTQIDYISEIIELTSKISFNNKESLKEIADTIKNSHSIFFIGKGLDYITCQEASLKLQEVTYINAQAYPSGELKHGFLALVDDDSYVFVVATNKELLEKTLNGAHEAQSRGAKIIIVSQYDISVDLLSDTYKFIKIQSVTEDLMPIISIIPFQQISYFTSTKKGINPDQPRNLAKSVTVE